MPGNEVGMEVRQEDVSKLKSEFLRVRQVSFNIALWIDNDRSRACFVPQQVGGMRQATQIILFENHEDLSMRPIRWFRVIDYTKSLFRTSLFDGI
jgi:hypothetical protein